MNFNRTFSFVLIVLLAEMAIFVLHTIAGNVWPHILPLAFSLSLDYLGAGVAWRGWQLYKGLHQAKILTSTILRESAWLVIWPIKATIDCVSTLVTFARK